LSITPQDNSSLSLYIRFGLSLLIFSFRERLERILEGGNIPPQRPSACSPQILEKHRAGHSIPQTASLSFSSTFFEGENIPPQRSLRSLLPLKNRHSSFVKVASIRLLRGMSFGAHKLHIFNHTALLLFFKIFGKDYCLSYLSHRFASIHTLFLYLSICFLTRKV